ncbi:MAG: response regulator, partial [Gammaproteobacteria bacterium]|nr:response regulator [Gammaproteobacteria bacterium]
MESNRIFIVEDEPSIAQTVQFTLEAEGFVTEHFSTGTGCLAALEATPPSLILLDVGLADGSGFEFFRRIRQLTEAPVIYLTARDAEI